MIEVEIIKLIHTAFADVQRGRITIHEAEVLDVHGFQHEAAAARLRDRETRWQDVPDDDIAECWCALPHLDPESWRYYIPAYMCWTLANQETHRSNTSQFTIFNLKLSDGQSLKEYDLIRFRTLSDIQSHAVYQFLDYMHRSGDWDAQEALERYWKAYQDPLMGRMFWPSADQ